MLIDVDQEIDMVGNEMIDDMIDDLIDDMMIWNDLRIWWCDDSMIRKSTALLYAQNTVGTQDVSSDDWMVPDNPPQSQAFEFLNFE